MASGPITSWQTDGETIDTVTHFIFLGSKITADCDPIFLLLNIDTRMKQKQNPIKDSRVCVHVFKC